MKISKFIFNILTLAAVFFLCSSFTIQYDKDAFMKKDTREYKMLTEKMLGTWKVTSLVDKENKEKMKTFFKKGSAKLDFDNNYIVIKLTLADQVISQNIQGWRKNKPDLVVTSYELVSTASWELVWHNPEKAWEPEEVYLVLKDARFDIIVKGSGNLGAFQTEELVKYAHIRDAALNMTNAETTAVGGEWGDLMGGVAGQLAARTAMEGTLGNTDYFYVLDAAGPIQEVKVKDNKMTWWKLVFER